MGTINESMVYDGLKETFKNSPEEEIEDYKKVKWIIFSDLHKGQGDGADDFKVCKPAYHAALGYYLAAGYTLILLGDVEEFWESFPKKVFKEYQDTFELEKKFTNVNGEERYLRIWGNHDDFWHREQNVDKYREKLMGESKALVEGKKFIIDYKGKKIVIFLAHGHQGTLESDRIRWLSRFIVRVVWRNIQRITRIPSTTPAKDFKLKKEHERVMYSWVKDDMKDTNMVFICGHTHRPVFISEAHEDEIISKINEKNKELQEAKTEKQKKLIQDEIYNLYAELEWVKSKSNSETSGMPANEPLPCFFNTGCCSFGDGDITGLEIADGEIRLVRWPDDTGKPKKKEIKSEKLDKIFNELLKRKS